MDISHRPCHNSLRKIYVEPSFVKRVAEAALEHLLRRYVSMLIAGIPPVCREQELFRLMGIICSRIVSVTCNALLFFSRRQSHLQVTEAMLTRLHSDEESVEAYFTPHLKPERLTKLIQQLADIRMLLSSKE